jgi:hypothetical protein
MLKIKIALLLVTLLGQSIAFAKCAATDIQFSFLQNCKIAGIQYYDSFGAKANNDKIESVCRCIVEKLTVETANVVNQKTCEFPLSEVRKTVRFKDVRVMCGEFQ